MGSNIAVSVSADTSKLTAQLAVAKAGLTDFNAQLRAVATQAREAGSAASDDLKVNLTKAADAAARAQAEVRSLQTQLRASTGQLRESSAALDAHAAAGEHNAGIFREKVVLAHELVQGNYTRMIGSMMVLSERTGSFSGALTTLLNPLMLTAVGVAAVAGGVVRLVMASEDAARSTNKLRTAFAAVGNGAAFNGAQVKRMADEVATLPGINREAGDQIIATFARTRQIGGQLLVQLIQDIDKSARAMGVDAPQAAHVLAAAFADPAKGAAELDRTYNFLTATQLRQIETMVRHGDLIGAQNQLLAAWKNRLSEIPDNLTGIEKASNSLATSWDKLLQSLGETSAWTRARDAIAGFMDGLSAAIRPDSLDAKLKSAQQHLNYLRDAARADASMEGYVAAQEKVVALLEREKAVRDGIAYEGKTVGEGKSLDMVLPAAAKDTGLSSELEKAQAAASQVKADLTDPALLSTRERLIQFDEVIRRLNAEAAAEEKKGTEESRANALILRQRADEQQRLRNNMAKSLDKGDQSQMSIWRQELSAQAEGLAALHAADADYHLQELRLERDFWTSKANLAKEGSKDQIEARKLASDASRRLAEADVQAAKEIARKQQDAEKDVANTDLRLMQMRLEAASEELSAEVEAGRLSAADRIRILRGITEAVQAEKLRRLDLEIAGLKDGDLAWVQAVQHRRVLVEQFTQQVARLDREQAKADKDAATQSGKAWTEAIQPISRAFDGMVSGIFQGTQTVGQVFRRMAGNMVLSFADSIAKMLLQFGAFKLANALGWTQIAQAAAAEQSALSVAVLGKEAAMTGATQAGAAARTAAGAIEQAGFLSRLGSQLAGWLGLETGKTAATVTGAATRDATDGSSASAAVIAAKMEAAGVIPAYAAEAGAAAMQSVAAIPVVGWAMAPAVGAETFAAAMSFLPMASAAGGWDRVPHDGAVTELHKDEMVLPASIATPLRALAVQGSLASLSMVMPPAASAALQALSSPSAQGGSTSGNSGSSGHGSPIVVQLNVQATDAASFNNRLQQAQTRNAIVQTIQRAVANGANLQPSR